MVAAPARRCTVATAQAGASEREKAFRRWTDEEILSTVQIAAPVPAVAAALDAPGMPVVLTPAEAAVGLGGAAVVGKGQVAEAGSGATAKREGEQGEERGGEEYEKAWEDEEDEDEDGVGGRRSQRVVVSLGLQVAVRSHSLFEAPPSYAPPPALVR